MKIRNTIKEFAVITVGTAIVAAVFFFMLPSHVPVAAVPRWPWCRVFLFPFPSPPLP